MKLEDFVAISGMPGLFKMVANRDNGLIVENIDSKQRKFVPARSHQFTPLVSIGIYTDDDTAELKVVFKTMLEQLEKNPPVKTSANSKELLSYFGTILPEFDRDRVHISDIKKVVKWFNFLNERSLISIESLMEEAKEEDTEETLVESKEKETTKKETTKSDSK